MAAHLARCVPMSQNITSMGLAYYRYGGHKPFGMNDVDRLQHLYVIGQTGTGKSTLLSSMMQSDAKCGRGFCLLDPHGSRGGDRCGH